MLRVKNIDYHYEEVFLFYILLLCITGVQSKPANPTPFKVLQPNGDTIQIRHIGDEYGSWY